MQTRLTVCLSPLLVLRIQDSPYPTGSEYVGIARGASGRLGSGYVGICRHGQDPIRTTPRSNTPNLQGTWRGACCLLIARRPRGAKRVAPPDNNSDLRPLEHRRQHGSEGAHISEGAHTHSRGKRPLRSWRIARSACSTPRPSQCRQVIVRVDMPRHRSAAPVIYYICLYSSYTYTPRRWGGLLTVYLVL